MVLLGWAARAGAARHWGTSVYVQTAVSELPKSMLCTVNVLLYVTQHVLMGACQRVISVTGDDVDFTIAASPQPYQCIELFTMA